MKLSPEIGLEIRIALLRQGTNLHRWCRERGHDTSLVWRLICGHINQGPTTKHIWPELQALLPAKLRREFEARDRLRRTLRGAARPGKRRAA